MAETDVIPTVVTAGDGITKSGNQLSISSSAITNDMLAGSIAPSKLSAGLVPVGTVSMWLKSYTSTPALPDGWLECNGQTVSDSDSPYDGQALPNLTGTAYFMRTSTTSGTTGGSNSHSHTLPSPGGSGFGSGGLCQPVCQGSSTDGANNVPVYYEFVPIIRIK